VTLRNSATNFGAVTNITAYLTNLGFTASQPVGVFNAWSNRFEYTTNGQFTAAVTNISAETYIIYPVTHPVELSETVYPYQLYYNPAPTFLGNAQAGPGGMVVESVARDTAATEFAFWNFPPEWATSLTLEYAHQTDQTTSYWTNEFREFQWDVDGARGFSPAPIPFNVNGTVGAIHRFTNTVSVSSHMPMGIKVTMKPGTNTTGSRYLLGPIVRRWR
jgi:hypothetical protein